MPVRDTIHRVYVAGIAEIWREVRRAIRLAPGLASRLIPGWQDRSASAADAVVVILGGRHLG